MKVRLGIDLGGTFIKAGIINTDSKIIASFKYPTEAAKGAGVVKYNLQDVYRRLLKLCQVKNHTPISLGIGSPGTIRQPDGLVTDATPNIPGWRGVVLTKVFGKSSLPVYADNDANVVALAEYYVGFKARYKNMLFITVGTGIGGGLIIDGKLHRGSHFAAAEIGHTTIAYDGKLCKCGLRGCLEAYASVPNMMRRATYWANRTKGKLPPDLTPQILYDLYKKGNRIAELTIKENAEYLGAGIGTIINTLNPEIVVIGGGFSGTGGGYIRLINEAIKKHAFAAATRKLKVVRAKLGNNAGFVGAGLLGLVDDNNRIE